MLANALTHWRSTLFGFLQAFAGAALVVPNLDKLTAGQTALALAGCAFAAIKGLVSADASATAPK